MFCCTAIDVVYMCVGLGGWVLWPGQTVVILCARWCPSVSHSGIRWQMNWNNKKERKWIELLLNGIQSVEFTLHFIYRFILAAKQKWCLISPIHIQTNLFHKFVSGHEGIFLLNRWTKKNLYLWKLLFVICTEIEIFVVDLQKQIWDRLKSLQLIAIIAAKNETICLLRQIKILVCHSESWNYLCATTIWQI